MDALRSLILARDCLTDVTPLSFDCGTLCGAICCRSDPGDEERGMLLFPREEELYADRPAFCAIQPSGWMHQGAPVLLMTCRGNCPRERRPLACRICPLTPIVRGGELRVEMDPRATMCPLVPSGPGGLLPAFVGAAQSASRFLWADPTQRAFLVAYSRQMDELRRLRRRFGAKR